MSYDVGHYGFSTEFIAECTEALLALDRAALGDSNDAEIEAGRVVADILAALVDYETPDDLEPYEHMT